MVDALAADWTGAWVCGGADTTGAGCRTKVGPEDEPDEDEVAVELDDVADAPVELVLLAASGDEGTPRLGPDELAGLMPSAPIIVAGADWEEDEAVALEFPELPGVGAAEAEGPACCEFPWRMSVGPALLVSEPEVEEGLLVAEGDAAVEGAAVEGAAADVPFPDAVSSAWITESSAPSRRNSVAASAVI